MKASMIAATSVLALGILTFGGVQYFKAEEQPKKSKVSATIYVSEQAKQIKEEQQVIENLEVQWLKAADEYEYKVVANEFLDKAKKYQLDKKYSVLVQTGYEFETFTKTQQEVAKMSDEAYHPYHNQMQTKREAFQYAIWDAVEAFYKAQGFYSAYSKDYAQGNTKDFKAQKKEKLDSLQKAADKLYATIGTESAINKDKAYQQKLEAYQEAFTDLLGKARVESSSNTEKSANIESYQVEKSEYANFTEFIASLEENWANGSEIRKGAADAYTSDVAVALPIINYINYFKKDIESLGLTKEFTALQNAAYELNQLSVAQFTKPEYEQKHQMLEKNLKKAVASYQNS